MSKKVKNNNEEQQSDNQEDINTARANGSQEEQPNEEKPDVKNVEASNNSNTEELKKKSEQYYSMFQRVTADFDNYKRRAAKERESLYQDATAEAVLAFLPVLDNFERALKAQDDIESGDGENAFKTGIEMLFRQFKDCFSKLGVKEIKSLGEKFDPNLHNAVMHIDDDAYGEQEIIEELQKGYIIGDKVVRHSMVKVAN